MYQHQIFKILLIKLDKRLSVLSECTQEDKIIVYTRKIIFISFREINHFKLANLLPYYEGIILR